MMITLIMGNNNFAMGLEAQKYYQLGHTNNPNQVWWPELIDCGDNQMCPRWEGDILLETEHIIAEAARLNKDVVVISHSNIVFNLMRLKAIDNPGSYKFLWCTLENEPAIEVTISPKGNIIDWPDGMFDTELKLQDMLVERNRKKER